MGKYKRMITILLIVCSLNILVSSVVESSAPNFDAIVKSFGNNEGKIISVDDDKTKYATDYVIYSDKSKGLILFCEDGTLKRFFNDETRVLKEKFSGNLLIGTEIDEINRRVQTSKDRSIIVFYGNEGTTCCYDFNKDTVEQLPMTYANIIWSSDGKKFEFITAQDPVWCGMGRVNVLSRGLYCVNEDGTFHELIDPGKYVGFKARKPDGAHFVVADILDPMDNTFTNINEMVYTDTQKTLIYSEYIPDGYNVVKYNGMKSYESVMAQIPNYSFLFISGNFVLTRYKDGFARYDTKTGAKKKINQPIGIYKGYYYYYSTPYRMGKIKKADISTLSKIETIRAYADGSSAYIKGNKLYYYNPQKNLQNYYTSVPYSEDLDTHKLSKLSVQNLEINNYYIFYLENGNKVGYSSLPSEPDGRLEDKDGKFICTVGQYYNGFFYGIEKTTDETYPAIVKTDSCGNKQSLVQIANKYVSIGNMTIYGGKIYFTSDDGGWNLYSSNLDGTNLKKY